MQVLDLPCDEDEEEDGMAADIDAQRSGKRGPTSLPRHITYAIQTRERKGAGRFPRERERKRDAHSRKRERESARLTPAEFQRKRDARAPRASVSNVQILKFVMFELAGRW